MIRFWLILANLDHGKSGSIFYYGSCQPLVGWLWWFLVLPLTMPDTDVKIRTAMGQTMNGLQMVQERWSTQASVNSTN